MISVRLPGDKSISHRALILASLAEGESRVRGLSRGADVAATAGALRALGMDSARVPEQAAAATLVGPLRPVAPRDTLDCGNSGTTARLLLGLIGGSPITARLDGDESLRRRPMARVADPLRAAGASVRELGEPGRLPIELEGGALMPIEHRSPVASAQVKSALLLAGLAGGVPVTVEEPGASRNHTELMLRSMGAVVETATAGGTWRVRLEVPGRPLRPLDLTVPGDFSSAAFWLGLAVLGGCRGPLRIERVGLNPTRTGFLRVLEAMGASLETIERGTEAGEPVGDIVAHPSPLAGVEVPPEWLPALLDEIPILACLAAGASGTTVVRGARELRVKESDRIAMLYRNLSRLGVRCRELPDGLDIEGSPSSLAGRVECEGDHRLAMAFGVLGAVEGNEIEIDDPACVDVSYPGFWDELERIKGMANA